MELKLDYKMINININEIKQRSLIAVYLKYEEEIEKIYESIKEAADKGEFMIYYNPKVLKIDRKCWTGILNVFDNIGFTTGIKDDKLLISWFYDLKGINLLEDYKNEETKIN